MDLRHLGWDERWEKAFRPYGAQGLLPARVITEDKHCFRVMGAHGEGDATIPGRVLHRRQSQAALPKVGDWTAVEVPAGPGPQVIHATLPRRTCLARKVAGRELREQVLVANVEVAFIVQALDQSYNLRRLERFLVMAHEGGLKPVVLLNKVDLCLDLARRQAESQACAGAAPVLPVSGVTGHGLRAVRAFIPPGQTVVFIGSSGVGKSTLINRLYGEDIQAIQEVRAGDAKGRHTTTWRELIPLPNGGLVIDTPGLREFHLWLAEDGLEVAFRDVAELAAGCHFRDCRHEAEQDCAVRQAVEQRRLTPERLASYQRLRRELKYLADERRRHTYRLRDARHRPPREADPFDPG